MKLSDYFKELQKSENFKQFIMKNPDTYFCSGFFVIDKEKEDNKQHLDFFVPNMNKMFSFQMENNVKTATIELVDKRTPERIHVNFDIDFGEMEDMILDEMDKKKISNKIQKMIYSLQRSEERTLLVGTIFLSMFGLLKVIIDPETKKITDFDKKSVFDMMKIFKKNN